MAKYEDFNGSRAAINLQNLCLKVSLDLQEVNTIIHYMPKKFLSLQDIEFAVKKKIYELENNAYGKTLIYDSKSRKYVGHLEHGNFVQDKNYSQEEHQRRVQEWQDFSGRDWGKNGW